MAFSESHPIVNAVLDSSGAGLTNGISITYVGSSAVTTAIPTYETATDSIVGAASRYRVQSAATNNAAVIKAGAGNVYGIPVSNNTGSAVYLKFFDMATSPTVGTDTPIATFLLPAGGHAPLLIVPLAFTVGIAIGIVTGKADSDNTAVGAGDVTGSIAYQ